jgi:hypothetical protein
LEFSDGCGIPSLRNECGMGHFFVVAGEKEFTNDVRREV